MVRLSLLALASSLSLALALPQPQNVCTTVCRPVKPECPEGEEAGGSEGCWGCCQPVAPKVTDVCTTECRPNKPECPEGEEAGGSETSALLSASPRNRNVLQARPLAVLRYDMDLDPKSHITQILNKMFRDAGDVAHLSKSQKPKKRPPMMFAATFADLKSLSVPPERHAPTGQEGCWGCCQPVDEEPEGNVCTLECRLEKPECPAGEAPTGEEGCWGCCQPIEEKGVKADVCTSVCRPEKPECPVGEAPTGVLGVLRARCVVEEIGE
ncbi:uncharacterized protein BJX67DRAFT_385652 [Aspergillus lucknowensis]|uniref:Uncharacterized protein n=1 Tax=Aspergillus lucknowensis TaxID=176173 RepID=A0ABR4LCY9_9EURO